MGLDISAYRKVAPAPEAEVDSGGWPSDWKRYLSIRQATLDMTEDYWPGHTEGIPPAGVYSFAEEFGLRAGSYGGYNRWREWLAEGVGHNIDEVHKGIITEGPFVELINFSDCEGYIGPIVAAKLHADFVAHRAKFTGNVDDGWFPEAYDKWMQAFEIAADGGLVSFH